MVQTFLGFITALAVVSWGVRWYLSQQERAIRFPSERAAAPGTAEQEPPPLVPRETAEQLMQSQAVDVEMPSVEEGEPSTEEPEAPASTPSTPEVLEGSLVGDETEDTAPGNQEPAAESEPEETFPEDAVVGYCARCRRKRVVEDATRTETKKGRPAIRGRCVVCAAGMFVFTSNKD